MLSLQCPHKHEKEVFVKDELFEGLEVLNHLLAVGDCERVEDRVVGPGTGEQKPHCKGTEVSIGEVFVVGNLNKIG